METTGADRRRGIKKSANTDGGDKERAREKKKKKVEIISQRWDTRVWRVLWTKTEGKEREKVPSFYQLLRRAAGDGQGERAFPSASWRALLKCSRSASSAELYDVSWCHEDHMPPDRLGLNPSGRLPGVCNTAAEPVPAPAVDDDDWIMANPPRAEGERVLTVRGGDRNGSCSDASTSALTAGKSRVPIARGFFSGSGVGCSSSRRAPLSSSSSPATAEG